MGNSIPSTSTSMPYPVRPFEPGSKRSCFTKGMIPIVSSSDKVKGSTLHQLIILQDWQRVLIRAKLYPTELQQYCNYSISPNEVVRVLPLHLVCALDPPATVVELLVELHADACAMPIEPIMPWSSYSSSTSVAANKGIKKNFGEKNQSQSKKKHKFFYGTEPKNTPTSSQQQQPPRWRTQMKNKSLSQRFYEWRQNRKGAFPVDVTYDMSLCFLPNAVTATEMLEEMGSLRLLRGETVKRVKVYDTSLIDHEESMPSDESSSSISSQNSFDSIDSSCKNGNKIILQLSPNGGLHPLPIDSGETECSSGSSSKTSSDLFRVRWDYTPLYEQVIQFGMLLPIHIACLFSAQADVVQILVSAFPAGCLISVVGMIPIHFVAAGWFLPPLLPAPVLHLPLPLGDIQPTKNNRQQIDLLQVLKTAMPDTVKVKSGNHGMTAIDYVGECMEESHYKKACETYLLQVAETQEQPLMLPNDQSLLDDYSYSTVESFIFSKSDTSSLCCSEHIGSGKVIGTEPRRTCASIGDMMIKRDWDGIITIIKADNLLASKWIYGMDQQPFSRSHVPMVWKRLPIHLACAYNAPVSVVSMLIESYPESLGLMDPHDGSLPLHIACQHASPSMVPTIMELLHAYPEAGKCVNAQGQLPLHVAIISNAPCEVVEALLKVDPQCSEIPDYYGMTAQDYADQIIDTPQTILKLLAEAILHIDDVQSV